MFRNQLLDKAQRAGFHHTAVFDAFTPLDPSTIYGDMAVFFQDTADAELAALIRNMTMHYQEFGLTLGSLDTHKQGFMTYKFANYWSPGYKELYTMLKQAVDPQMILNRDLWEAETAENTP